MFKLLYRSHLTLGAICYLTLKKPQCSQGFEKKNKKNQNQGKKKLTHFRMDGSRIKTFTESLITHPVLRGSSLVWVRSIIIFDPTNKKDSQQFSELIILKAKTLKRHDDG